MASSYVPSDYNVTYLAGITSANFDQSGNLVGQLSIPTTGSSPSQTYTYITSGPDTGNYHVTNNPPGSGQQPGIIYQVSPAPSFNPGPLPGEQQSTPLAANSAGQQIGESFAFSGIAETAQHGYLYSGGQMIPLIPTGANGGTWSSNPIAINQVGQVVFNGGTPSSVGANAYLYSNGTTTNLGTLGGTTTYAANLNDKGQVVGWSDSSNSPYSSNPSAFVYENGKMYDLSKMLINPPSNLVSDGLNGAIAINDLGQIIAGSNDYNNRTFGLYLLTPSDLPAPPAQIPEPSSWALFGLMFLAASKRVAGRDRA